jgi:sec-independent protein translocase protein TatC
MSIFDHLNELRQRLTKAFLGLIIGTLFSLLFTQTAFDVLREPYCQVVDQPAQCQLVTLGPTGGVVAYFRVALMMGAVLSIPLITYQLLMFIFPGLTRREKRFVLSSLPAITILFLGGVVFSWYILMPPALGFLEGFAPTVFRPEWTADLYLSFVTSLLFWMGVAFQTPLVFFVLSILGLVTAAVLIRNWRIAIVGAAIAAALITPTVDPVNMFIVMGPLLVLYLFSILLVMIGRRFSTPRP